MTKRLLMFLVVAALLGTASISQAANHTGRLGLNYTVGPSFILGGDGATDTSSVEPGVGAGLQLGLSPNLDVRFDYDYTDADLHTQALTFGAQWGFTPDAAVNPFVGAGLGFGKPYSGEGWDHFSMKLSGGVEKELTPSISLAALMTYQFVDGNEPFGSVHTMEPGVRLTYYFGSFTR
jgi:opacity protein-like surface antigen